MSAVNELGREQSGYLLQHKENPIHWRAFSMKAIEEARAANRPIFLSIGYSSCHWCHVMAHESFQDQNTADFLNKNFVCIKVDREEHPELDAYYQEACQLYIKAGGWPLSAFLTHDLAPFFVGTYFPKTKRQGGGASFMELLEELNRAWNTDRAKVDQNAKQATETIAKGRAPKEKIQFNNHFPAPMAILDAIKDYADKDNGGYGDAPKFPHFPFYEWALEQMLEGMVDRTQGQHIVNSLERMLMGGMTDHARGGIHRYSVDPKFMVPHFEKMLYDQAGFLRVLAKLALVYPSPLVIDSLISTLDYLSTEMISEKGHFFAAQDADSEGVEGLYFTFTEEEFELLVNKASDENDDLTARLDEIKRWFSISTAGNFEHELSVLSLNHELKDEYYTPENWEIIRRVRKSALETRKSRIPPMTDSKGIASWNFLMISALADVLQYARHDAVRTRAAGLFNRVVEGSYQTFIARPDGGGVRLLHATTRTDSLAYFEDVAFFAEAQLRLYEVSGNPVFKQNLKETLDYIEKEFFNGTHFLTTNKTSDSLIPNQQVSSFDQSFKSPSATLLSVVRRARVLFLNPELGKNYAPAFEDTIQFALRNPVSAGEALRASTYPENAYRVMKLPRSWPEQNKFASFIAYFLPRFVFDYHDDGDTWQICSSESCELSGTGLDEFIAKLTPKKEQ
jgi:uncharacterized protein YyaL (SSP411 family)